MSYNLFLLQDGEVFVSGEISYAYGQLLEAYDGIVNLNERMAAAGESNVYFVDIKCGNSHALLRDDKGRVFVFGVGVCGQLGLGPEWNQALGAVAPISLQCINDTEDKVMITACGPNFSLCYTELGILYVWGMIKSDDFDAIEWSPAFFNVSLPKDNLTEEDLYEFHLTDIKANLRSIFACDSKGRLYQCDTDGLNTLKPVRPPF